MTPRERIATARVADVMKRRAVTIGLDVPVANAADLMRGRRIRHLPVVDDQQRLRGIITDRDVQHAALLPALAAHASWDPRRIKSPRVRDVMTWSAVTAAPDTPLVHAGLVGRWGDRWSVTRPGQGHGRPSPPGGWKRPGRRP